MAPLSPPTVPDYQLLRCIGRGSYGEVWLARDILGALRAAKIVHRHRFAEARPFEREFEGLQKFAPISRSHPSQLHILHVGKNDAAGCFYYVMELADASESVISNPGQSQHPVLTDSLNTDSLITDYSPRTLASDLRAAGRLPFTDCLRIALTLADALDHLHRHGLIHRDIKPSNIIFVNGTPKLADIGLVTEQGEDKSRVGTEGFIPPEGPGTAQADIYSLGKVLYEISTGKDRQRFPEPLTALADLPDHKDWLEFNAIVEKACANDPARRYATAAALRADLALVQAGQSIRQHRATQRQLARLKKWGAWAAAAALALVGGLLILQWKSAAEARAARRESLLRQVQMIRQTARTNGWFDACWERLREFTRLQPDEKARDDARTQAAACLNWPDTKLVAAQTNIGSFSLAYSPDGQWLLCAGLTHERTRAQQSAHLWRVPTHGRPSLPRRPDLPARERSDAGGSVETNLANENLGGAAAPPYHEEFHPLPVSGDAVAAWQPDGTTNGTPVLLLPGPTNRFVLVEAATSNVLREFVLEGNPSQGNESHPVLALTPDARLAAASVALGTGRDAFHRVRLPSETNGTLWKASPPEAAPPIAPEPQGRFAVWDTATGRVLLQTNEPASALAFSPDGRALAVGDAEGRVRVFALPGAHAAGVPFPAARRKSSLTSSPGTVPEDNLRNEDSGGPPESARGPRVLPALQQSAVTLLAEFPSARVRINCFAFTRDPIVPRTGPLTNAWWLAVGDAGSRIRIFRTETREQLSQCRGSSFDVLAMRFSPDATLLASAGRQNLHLWDSATGSELLHVPYFLGTRPDFIRSLGFSPDGTRLAIGGGGAGSYRESISLWRFETERGSRTLRGLTSPIAHVWFSPNQNRVAALAHDWRLAVWERFGGRLLHIFEMPRNGTADNVSLAFHPDSVQFAFSAGAEVALWDSTSGETANHWTDLPEAGTVQLAFDGQRRLLTVRNEREPGAEHSRRWRVRHLSPDGTSTVLAQQTEPLDWQTYGFALTPDARFFAAWNSIPGGDVAQWELRLIETLTGRELQRHAHLHAGNTTAVMDASGRYLAFPAGDSQAKVRTIPDWKLVHTLNGTSRMAPDGKTMAGRTADGAGFTVVPAVDAPSIPLARVEVGLGTAGPVFSPKGDWVAWGSAHGLVGVADWRAIQSGLSELSARNTSSSSPAR